MTRQDKLDDLLARGRLAAPRRERIFEEVYRRVRGGGARARSKYVIIAGPLALAAALAVLLRPQGDGQNRYASKGLAASNVEVDCSGGPLSRCPRGSRLVFRIDTLPAPGFLHAYAEPLEEGFQRIWYFPTAASQPPRVEPAEGGQVLERGIVVGPEHTASRYRLHVLITGAPLSRQDVLAPPKGDVIAAGAVEMVVVGP